MFIACRVLSCRRPAPYSQVAALRSPMAFWKGDRAFDRVHEATELGEDVIAVLVVQFPLSGASGGDAQLGPTDGT